MNADELIEQYGKELEMDTQVDVTNIIDKSYSLPNVKHKWLYRRTKAEQFLNNLILRKEELLNQKTQNSSIPVSTPALRKRFENDKDIKDLTTQIVQQELLVKFLNDEVTQLNQIGFLYKNIIDLMKMENL